MIFCCSRTTDTRVPISVPETRWNDSMICPSCGHVNVPGADNCAECLFSLAAVDSNPTGQDAVEHSFLYDSVSRLKPRPAVTISVDETLGLALDRLVENSVGALLVVDAEHNLVGILTERDYLNKLVPVDNHYARMPLRDIMTPNPVTVKLDDPLASVLQKMDDGGYRHLPVVQDGKPVGIVSVRDVIKHITRLCENGH